MGLTCFGMQFEAGEAFFDRQAYTVAQQHSEGASGRIEPEQAGGRGKPGSERNRPALTSASSAGGLQTAMPAVVRPIWPVSDRRQCGWYRQSQA